MLPLSWFDLEAKFCAATRLVATPAQQAVVLDMMREARGGRLPPLLSCLAD